MTLSQAIEHYVNTKIGDTFTAQQLRIGVMANLQTVVAPSSTDRLLRRLRQQNKLNYEVINANQSLYRALPLRTVLEASTTPAQ